MWKPGAPKPAAEKAPSPPSLAIKKGLPSNKTSSAKKKLSGSTMGMRFMQKQSNYQQVAVTPKKTPKKSPKKEENGVQAMQVEDGDDSDSDEEVTNSDMYGTQSDLIGRRSYGGFKKAIDNNWQNSVRFMNGEDVSRQKQHISDEELLRKYSDRVKGRDGNNNNNKNGGKKRKNGISSGGSGSSGKKKSRK